VPKNISTRNIIQNSSTVKADFLVFQKQKLLLSTIKLTPRHDTGTVLHWHLLVKQGGKENKKNYTQRKGFHGKKIQH